MATYDLSPRKGYFLAFVAGVPGIVVWILPGYVYSMMNLPDGWWRYFGFADRSHGFNPAEIVKPGSATYWATLAVRMLRLIIVVPLVEEIFWRGFLMRYIVRPDRDCCSVPFGMCHRDSLVIVTVFSDNWFLRLATIRSTG